jgi:uncharacterized protein GlcG (DUF336 family)
MRRRIAVDPSSGPRKRPMNSITLDVANKIVAGALAKGRELELKPLTVAVLDPGGHLVALQRSDSASNLRPQIAIAKAAGALSLGTSSRRIGEMAAERPAFFGSLGGLSQQGIVPAAGGLLILGERGELIGAVGVTGDHSDQDEICASAGIGAAGLKSRD